MCHPRCLPNLPPNCGLPSDYARFTADVRHGAVNNGRMMAAKKSASALQLAAYVKLPRLLIIDVFISSCLPIYVKTSTLWTCCTHLCILLLRSAVLFIQHNAAGNISVRLLTFCFFNEPTFLELFQVATTATTTENVTIIVLPSHSCVSTFKFISKTVVQLNAECVDCLNGQRQVSRVTNEKS